MRETGLLSFCLIAGVSSFGLMPAAAYEVNEQLVVPLEQLSATCGSYDNQMMDYLSAAQIEDRLNELSRLIEFYKQQIEELERVAYDPTSQITWYEYLIEGMLIETFALEDRLYAMNPPEDMATPLPFPNNPPPPLRPERIVVPDEVLVIEGGGGPTDGEAGDSPEIRAPMEFRIEQPPELLDFPWPPPTPSDRIGIDRQMIVAPEEEEGEASVSMLDLSERFTGALNDMGYTDHRFYGAPGNGFALITRMERIRSDGTPEPEELRFLDPDAQAPFSLGRFMSELFFAPEGYYRVIVFVVTTDNFVPTGPGMTEEQADLLLSEGLTRLPRVYDEVPFSEDHYMDALIYEFYKGPRDMDVNTVAPVRLAATVHLSRIGFEEALETQREANR